MASTPPATTPSSSRFKLFLFSRRTKSASAVGAALVDDRSPPIGREASRSSLRVWQSNGSSSSVALGCYTDSDPARSVQTCNATRVRATPSPPPPSQPPLAGPRSSHPAEASMHTRGRELHPTFSPGLRTPPRSRSPRHIEGERNVGMYGNPSSSCTDVRAAHWQRPSQQGCRRDQSPPGYATPPESPPNMRRHGRIYPSSGMSLCTPPHHPREAVRAEDPPADEDEINLEDYPWFMCRLIAGVNVKMDLKAQGGTYWV